MREAMNILKIGTVTSAGDWWTEDGKEESARWREFHDKREAREATQMFRRVEQQVLRCDLPSPCP